MSSFGQVSEGSAGRSIQAACNGNLESKAGGVTVDWSTVAASGGAGTLPDNVPYAIGDKYLRYGQVLTEITASGKYGPYDSAASDGREVLTRGKCHIVNETVFENDAKSDHPPTFEGGHAWRNRLIVHATVASLANGPTLATFLTAFPRVRLNWQA